MNQTAKYGLTIFLFIALINFGVGLFFILIGSWLGWQPIYLILLDSLIASIGIALLVILGTPTLRGFLVTYRRLLRLENLSHPLLLRLSSEAPGTYHHSLNATQLAYKAGKAIGADALLIRVGGYYHDIGKLSHPQFFIENQKDENIHETLQNPKKSAGLIINHIKEGIKLAQENHFPQEIIDFIPQHHGTAVVSYFYNQAKEQNPKVLKKDFTYPGPKPLTKETAILMLADIIEAKARPETNLTPEKIKEIVKETIVEKVQENQFDLSGLTPTDFAKITKAFQETLASMFHQRIKYPQK